jgi:hypothetical protein
MFTANLTPKGLMVRYPGWLLGCRRDTNIQARFHIIDHSSTVYMVSCFDNNSCEYLPLNHSFNPWFSEPSHIQTASMHLISQYDLDEVGINGPRVSHDALLVLAYDVHQDVILVRSVCPVTVRKLEGKASQDVNDCIKSKVDGLANRIKTLGLWSSSESSSNAIDIMGCSAIGKDQPWCID